MLTKWNLGNFKAISDTVTFSLAPITIFVGENSSGKSSVLQSILLLAQTLKATSSRQPLVLNGEFIRLGYMSDIVHEGMDHLPLHIGFELHPSFIGTINGDKLSPIEVDFRVNAHVPDLDNREGVLSSFQMKRGKNDQLEIERTFPKGGTILDEEEYENLGILTDVLNDIKMGIYDYTVKYILVSQGRKPSPFDIYSLHASLYHFLPSRILEPYNSLQFSIIQVLKIMSEYLDNKRAVVSELDALTTVPPINLNDLRGTFGSLVRREISNALIIKGSFNTKPTKDEYEFTRTWQYNLENSNFLDDWTRRVKTSTPQYIKRFSNRLLLQATRLEKELPSEEGSFVSAIGARSIELPTTLQEITSQIQEFFKERVYYLGPLRDDPRFIYNLPPYPELTHVGLKGEFTASVFERFKNVEIEYPIPPKEVQGADSHSDFIKIGKATLKDALEQWLVYMGLLNGVLTEDMGKIGTQLSVHSKGVKRLLDLTSIGVGVSQILPTLVTGLIAPRGTTFLMEQPELHLHPRVQSMVADFLIGLTKVGKQCIVETHSEYLVNRIRRRVAEDETSALEKEAQIYFAERKDGKSSFRALNLDEFGALTEWPDGFFDDGPNEAELIMRAALRKEDKKEAKGNK